MDREEREEHAGKEETENAVKEREEGMGIRYGER